VRVKGEEKSVTKDEISAVHEYALTIGPEGKITTTLVLTVPAGKGPFPVIVKGDLCWKRVKPEIVQEVVEARLRPGGIRSNDDRAGQQGPRQGRVGRVSPTPTRATWPPGRGDFPA